MISRLFLGLLCWASFMISIPTMASSEGFWSGRGRSRYDPPECRVKVEKSEEKWQHDLFQDPDKAPTAFSLLYDRLKALNSESDFHEWANDFERVRIEARDWPILGDLLEELVGWRAHLLDADRSRISEVFSQYISQASQKTSEHAEFLNFEKAFTAFRRLEARIPHDDAKMRNAITNILEKNLRLSTACVLLSRLLGCFEEFNISLSPSLEKMINTYLTNSDRIRSRNVPSLTRFCSHYRLRIPLSILEAYRRSNDGVKYDIMTLRNLSVSLLNRDIDAKKVEGIFLSLMERINQGPNELSDTEQNMLWFAQSAYEAVYQQASPIDRIGDGVYRGDSPPARTVMWNHVLRHLKKKYPDIEFEKIIWVTAAPVDAYLERHGQKFVIQLDGPMHFLFYDNDRETIRKYNGASEAQTVLLEENGYVVIRADYLQGIKGEAFRYIDKQIRKYEPASSSSSKEVWVEKKVHPADRDPGEEPAPKRQRK